MYLQYTKIPKTVLTIGQLKAPFGLESTAATITIPSSNVHVHQCVRQCRSGKPDRDFRGLAPKEDLNIAAGLSGDNESISRGSGANPAKAGASTARDLEASVRDGKIVHLGISGYYRKRLNSGDTPDAVG